MRIAKGLDRATVGKLNEMLQRFDQSSIRRSRGSRLAEGPRRGWRFFGPGAAFSQFLTIAVMLPILFFAFASYRDWRDIETEASARITYIRDALTEHSLRVFKTHQLVAFSIRDRIMPLSWEGVAGSLDLHDYLAGIARDFPEVQMIWLIDGEGQLRASSGAFPVEQRDASEQPWFIEMRDGTEDITVVPRDTSVVGHPESFTINFRRGGSGADFNGMVRIAVSPEYFSTFYDSAYPNEGVIALVHRDGRLLIRYPHNDAAAAQLAPGSHFFDAIAAQPAGFFTQQSTVDGAVRHYGYSQVANFPVYVGFGLGQRELYRLWRMRMQSYGIYFIPAGLALLLLAFLAWRNHRDLENVVELRTAALSSAIAEKNQLLKEVHHRVKNNMQIISSLIRMQDRVQTSPDETIRRVQAMALVHDLIYTHDVFASVNLAAYTHRMIDSVRGANGGQITFDLDLDPVTVALDRAMPFALILSEIVTNATRHAFPEGRGTVKIVLKRDGDAIELCVHDDGVGHNPEVDGRGFGMRLVKSLAVQLNADISFERQDGTRFKMKFPIDEFSEQIA